MHDDAERGEMLDMHGIALARKEQSPMDTATIGRVVHYTLSDLDLDSSHKHLKGKVRPAIVVNDWGANGKPGQAIQLQVFTDSTNDGLPAVYWKTSVMGSETPEEGRWHWPQRA